MAATIVSSKSWYRLRGIDPVVAALKAIYQSATAEEALRELDAFEGA